MISSVPVPTQFSMLSLPPGGNIRLTHLLGTSKLLELGYDLWGSLKENKIK